MSDKKNPPISIAAAAILSFVPVLLAPVRLLLIQHVPLSIGRIIAWTVAFAFFGWISLCVYRGKKWSWWWIVVSTTIGTALMFLNPQFPTRGAELLIYWVQAISLWLSCIILLLPSNRKWFAA